MKVLHICSSYFETSLYKSLFSELEKSSCVNFVYVPRWYYNKEDKDKHIYVIGKKFSKISKLFYWGEQKHILNDIERRINLSGIDFIHVHRILYGGYAALHIKKKYGIPYIVAIRYSDLYGWGRNMSLYKMHCLKIINNASRVIFISEPYKEWVMNLYKNDTDVLTVENKINIIPNGIDDFFLKSVIKTNSHPSPKEGIINLISIGTVDKRKNVLVTLETIDLLIDMGYKVTLKLAGKITDASIFEKVKRKTYVKYLGVLTKEQILEEMSTTDIFILPSVYETFGLVYAEAMTQGLPVIYTRGQGFDGQYKDGEVGYAVDCHNAQEIANRILDILSNYRIISNNCIQYSQRYSWTRIAKEYLSIYSVCQKK